MQCVSEMATFATTVIIFSHQDDFGHIEDGLQVDKDRGDSRHLL